MSRCEQEMCPYWTGQGCICAAIPFGPNDDEWEEEP